MPRVAAKLDVPQVSEILAVESSDTFRRPIYAGNAIATVQAPAGKKVITVRTTTFKAADTSGSGTVEKISRPATQASPNSWARSFPNPNAPNSLGQDRDLGWARNAVGRQFPHAGQDRRQVARSRRRQPRGGGRGLCPQRLSGRPDRQSCGAGPLYRSRHLRRDSASGGHEGFRGHRRHQQRRGASIFQVADYGLVADLFKAIPEMEEELTKMGY